MTREYNVIYRDFKAWVVVDGQRTGPFPSMAAAENAAISLAKLDFKVGQLARVTVNDVPDRVVYDNSSAVTSTTTL